MFRGEREILRGLIEAEEPEGRPEESVCDGIASRRAHGHEIGVKLLLAANREPLQRDDFEDEFERLAAEPEQPAEGVAEGRRKAALCLAPIQEVIQKVFPDHEIADDLPRDPGVGVRVRGLAEVPEFVGDHGLELAQVHTVHQAQADEHVALRFLHEIDERGAGDHGRVHIRADVNAVGFRCVKFLAELVDEAEEDGLLIFRDLDVPIFFARMPFEEALHEEEERDAEENDAANFDERPGSQREGAVGAQQDAERDEPKVEEQEHEQRDEQHVLLGLVRGGIIGEVFGDVRRAGRVRDLRGDHDDLAIEHSTVRRCRTQASSSSLQAFRSRAQ